MAEVEAARLGKTDEALRSVSEHIFTVHTSDELVAYIYSMQRGLKEVSTASDIAYQLLTGRCS